MRQPFQCSSAERLLVAVLPEGRDAQASQHLGHALHERFAIIQGAEFGDGASSVEWHQVDAVAVPGDECGSDGELVAANTSLKAVRQVQITRHGRVA